MQIFFILLIYFGLSCQALNAEENFILIDGSSNEIIKEFGSGVEEHVTPASTFKIVLSLIGYDSGILQDEQIPTWNFQEGYEGFLESWKESQNPQTWMTRSCIWFSKLIVFELGLERLEQYLSLLGYGNQDVSTGMVSPGPNNPLWVSSSLKISPKEKVDFIQKIVQEKLPVSNYALHMTKKLLFKEELSGGWKLFGKTGLGTTIDQNDNKLRARWFVGWVENDRGFFPFAYLLKEKEVDVLQTVPRVKQLLEETL